MSELVWMGHAGHFIGSRYCGFHLNTYVEGFIVSTVGEYRPSVVFEDGKLRARKDADPLEPLGYQADSFYETMVFPAKQAQGEAALCCPWTAADWGNLEGQRYSTPGAAYAGHLAMIEKYSAKAETR